MYSTKKLRSDWSVTGIIPALATLAGMLLFGALFGRIGAVFFAGAACFVLSVFAFVAWLRTRSTGYLVTTFYILALAMTSTTFAQNLMGNAPRSIARFFYAWVVIMAVVMMYMAFTKRYKWRGREILELAAAPIEEAGNGFTARPRPSGMIEYTKGQLEAFAEFAGRNLIALPHEESDKILFVPVMMGREFGPLFGLNHDYRSDTWVSFDFEGNVSVNISQRDYLGYRDALSFDQLCESLGNVYIEFFEMFRRGEGSRIIDRLNAVGVHPFA